MVLARAGMGPGSKMLIAAWTIEGACILIGLTLAIAAGLEVASSPWMALSAALPFAAAAVVESGRIPLVRGFFYARGLVWRAVALVGVLVVGCLTFENLIFGLERAFAVRIEGVRAAAETSAAADRRVADLKAIEGRDMRDNSGTVPGQFQGHYGTDTPPLGVSRVPTGGSRAGFQANLRRMSLAGRFRAIAARCATLAATVSDHIPAAGTSSCAGP